MAVTQEELRQAGHERLLDGLAEAIREKGLAQAQVSDIVRHARASRRTFYNHFPDKDACFVELMARKSLTMLQEVAAAIDVEQPVEDQVDAAVDAYLQALLADPGLAVAFFSAGLSEKVVLAQREGMESYARLLVESVSANAARGRDVRPLSLTQAYMLVAGFAHTVGRAIEHGEDIMTVAGEVKQIFKIVRTRGTRTAGR